jgi:hypothetical protein
LNENYTYKLPDLLDKESNDVPMLYVADVDGTYPPFM